MEGVASRGRHAARAAKCALCAAGDVTGTIIVRVYDPNKISGKEVIISMAATHRLAG